MSWLIKHPGPNLPGWVLCGHLAFVGPRLSQVIADANNKYEYLEFIQQTASERRPSKGSFART